MIMGRNTILGILLFLPALFFSCSNGNEERAVRPDVVEKGEMARKTLLVYMMAENSLANYATLDVNEIVEAVGGVPRDCRLFVYVDDKEMPRLTHYFGMTDGGVGSSVFHPFDNDVCSSDTAVLGELLDFILADYPTESLDLVMWSHGDGWLRAPLNAAPQRSIGIDNGNNSYSNAVTKTIEIEELAALLKRLPAKVNRILFDACFMQGVESSYALRDAAEWIIASPAEIPGDGAPYASVVPAFFCSDGPELVMDAYIAGYENEYSGAVLSAVRGCEMQRLADVTYSYVLKYFNVDKNRDYPDVFSYLPGGRYTGSKVYPSYYDMNAIMSKYLTSDELIHWREAHDAAVVYVASSSAWYSAVCGRLIRFDRAAGGALSMYMPQHNSRNEKFNADFRTTEWYMAAGWEAAGW